MRIACEGVALSFAVARRRKLSTCFAAVSKSFRLEAYFLISSSADMSSRSRSAVYGSRAFKSPEDAFELRILCTGDRIDVDLFAFELVLSVSIEADWSVDAACP